MQPATIAGSFDHGPVQATTTATRTMIGSQPGRPRRPDKPCASACAACAGHRRAAIAERLRRPPDLEQEQQAGEADDRADDVRQIGPEIDRGRQLAGDVAERADDGERPRLPHALLPADEVEQDPGRQQRQDRDDLADRGRADGSSHEVMPRAVTAASAMIGAPSAP